MSHHPGALILLRGKKKHCRLGVEQFVYQGIQQYAAPSTLRSFQYAAPQILGIRRKNTGSDMGSKILRSISRILGHSMTCERSFSKHRRKRSVPLRGQSGLRIFCAHRFIMRGQTAVYTLVPLIFPSLLYFTVSVQLLACCYNLF